MKQFNTPMMQQYQEIKLEHPDTVLLFRMGDFYEMFLDDAVQSSKILNIALTNRSKGQDGEIPMCGVPYHAIDNYLPKLVKAGVKVAICEQLEDPKDAKGLVKRGVVRIITPGTIYEESILDNKTFNYLATFKYNEKSKQGIIVYIDISTGDFKYTQVSDTSIPKLVELLAKISPNEVVLQEKDYNDSNIIKHLINYRLNASNFQKEYKQKDNAKSLEKLKQFFNVNNLTAFKLDENNADLIQSIDLIIDYLQYTHKESLNHVNNIKEINEGNKFKLDIHTIRNLEILHSQSAESVFSHGDLSFISVTDKTSTPMGARLFRENIINLSKDLDQLQQKHSAIEFIRNNIELKVELDALLRSISDIPRLTAKVNSVTASPKDLVTLKDYLIQSILILKKTYQTEIYKIVLNLEEIESLDKTVQQIIELTKRIDRSIIEEPPAVLKDKEFIKEGIDEELDAIKKSIEDSKIWLEDLERREKNATGISTLKVKYNNVFGYFIEVSKTNSNKVPSHYVRKQTLVNAERYITEELKEKEDILNSAKDKINAIELRIFDNLKAQVLTEIDEIKKLSNYIANIDVFISQVKLIEQYNLTKPILQKSENYELKLLEAKHIVVESSLTDNQFTPNDTEFTSTAFLHLITGPNMAGKSTYIRQVALLQIMAQAGMYVPASHAVISIVDGIYTRIGAADSLAQGLSTFMVEMLETAKILNSATKDSLVILDEVGRGTSTTDGLAIAKAIVEYIHNKIKCKTLFATHYHELTTLEQKLKSFKNYKILISEENGEVKFLHKVVPGFAEKSYGIEVAKLAGLPDEVITRAQKLLEDSNPNQLKLEI